ncbi:hypothetical protein [Alkalicoccus luteus]|nr:hypothetical protein [Alkalicoccus luteus]
MKVKKQSRLPIVTFFSNKQIYFPDVSGGGATSSLKMPGCSDLRTA